MLSSDWMKPKEQPAGNKSTILTMPPESIVFWEIPDAHAEACSKSQKKRYARSVENEEKVEVTEMMEEKESDCWWREGDTMVQMHPNQVECHLNNKEEIFSQMERNETSKNAPRNTISLENSKKRP